MLVASPRLLLVPWGVKLPPPGFGIFSFCPRAQHRAALSQWEDLHGPGQGKSSFKVFGMTLQAEIQGLGLYLATVSSVLMAFGAVRTDAP